MNDPHLDVDLTIRRAMGGDGAAVAWIVDHAATCTVAAVAVMAALLAPDRAWLDRARAVAATSRDRQLVAIATAHLDGDPDLVDALAREHLVDHPGNLVVAWIVATAPVGTKPPTVTSETNTLPP